MRMIDDHISLNILKKLATRGFGNLVKAVVDVEKEVMAIDGELHADEEALLLEHGSGQKDLWGINLYPDVVGPDWIEFDSMINVRPTQDNLTRGVDNPKIRRKVIHIVNALIVK